jgi:hypothetical protein
MKTKYRHPTGLLQQFPIQNWKWEVVTINFITKLHKTMKQHDSIVVVVDKFYSSKDYTQGNTYCKNIHKEVTRLHGVPKAIVSDKEHKFTSNFWKGLFKGFGTNLNLDTTYHLELDGKIERTNIIIEDMLKMYVIDQPSKWEDCIHLVEFVYNNGYQASLKMNPFKALYDMKCNTPVRWDNPADRIVIGSYLLKEMEERMEKIK